MAARAIWKAEIRLEDLHVPVKLYSAVEDRNIHFHLLHDQDMVRIKQRMVHPATGQTVPFEQMRKGYEVERGVLVILDEEDLDSLEPGESREIRLLGFVEPAQINHQWYDRPNWLGPDGEEATYFAMVQALADGKLEGVARWTMRKKQYVGALRAEQGYLALVTLRHAEQIVPADQLEPPSGRQLDKKERDLAGKLVEALQGDFDPDDYHDEYRDRVRELIETKQEGGTVQVEEYERKPARKSLAESLQASLEAVG